MGHIQVMLVDDHNLVRAGIRSLLQNLPDIEIVNESCSGAEALACLRDHQPDLILMDIGLQDVNGLTLARQVKKDYPQVKVIFLSMHSSEEYVMQALQIGASGYLLKDGTLNELELAIRAVASGGAYLSPVISRRVIDSYMKRVEGGAREKNGAHQDEKHLTSRQEEILKMIADGQTTKEIAARLEISIKTVDAHRTAIMKELDIHDVAGLVRYAIRKGLVSAE